jgi:predicted alpha/beta-fold hydrolase
MPLLSKRPYLRPKPLFNGHLETIYPALFRQVILAQPDKEQLETFDEDFLELDWHRRGNAKLLILSHGLEGNSSKGYILGMAKEALNKGFDVLAWNYRGCGDQLNRKAIFYHSGATYDLHAVVNRAAPDYEELYLGGFSLGGNLTLKYLGEGRELLPKIKRAVAISVPLDLGGSCDKISNAAMGLYTKRFLTSLRKKIERKASIFPKEFSLEKFNQIHSLRDFDNLFTGPLHGFSDAEDYYQSNSALQFLPTIPIPTLILNAQNDPFLSETCFPFQLAADLEQVYCEFPKHGGHVGFSVFGKEKSYYSEIRAVEFIRSGR